MASTIKVDNIQNSAGQDLLVNGYPRQPGSIIEYLSSPCDGSTVTVGSGTYTFPNVTTGQNFDTNYADITGSTISYTPPPGTKQVIYKFDFAFSWRDVGHSIQHYKFFIDGVEVLYARNTKSGGNLENRSAFEWTINIGGIANTNTGRQTGWTTPKTLKMQSRRYQNAYHGGQIHNTYYWDGGGSNQFSMPILTILAIA